MSKWRRFEVMLPLQFNDGGAVPRELIGEALFELTDYFGSSSFETQKIVGQWRHSGVSYRDNLVRMFVDVADTQRNRTWMK